MIQSFMNQQEEESAIFEAIIPCIDSFFRNIIEDGVILEKFHQIAQDLGDVIIDLKNTTLNPQQKRLVVDVAITLKRLAGEEAEEKLDLSASFDGHGTGIAMTEQISRKV